MNMAHDFFSMPDQLGISMAASRWKYLQQAILCVTLGLLVITTSARCEEQMATLNRIQLVSSSSFIEALGDSLPEVFQPVPLESLNPDELVKNAAAGGSIVWIGPPDKLPADLWIGSFTPSTEKLAIQAAAASPIPVSKEAGLSARIQSAFIHPPIEFPKHNIDEEIRADFLPILEAKDRFGTGVGFPGVLLNHAAPSLAGNRFQDCAAYIFFFSHPEKDIDLSWWKMLLTQIAAAVESSLAIEKVETNYASCHQGERVQVRVRIKNRQSAATAMQIRLYHQTPDGKDDSLISDVRRVAGGGSATEALFDYLPPAETGLHRIRVDVAQDVANRENLAVVGIPRVLMSRQIAFVMLDSPLKTQPCLRVEGPNFSVSSCEMFLAGTHYYPSDVWWEWAWRDFRPAIAVRDFEAMRRAGNRIVRVWVDPVLDEPVLRAMDAAIWLAGQNGITLDICVFNQWVRDLGYEKPDGTKVHFEYRHPQDFNIYSFSLRNLQDQRDYIRVLARRWKGAGNIIYNLANETYVKDPDSSQMDAEAAAWTETQLPSGSQRDSLIFRRWANEMEEVIRREGGSQIVFPGYMFNLSHGGDTYLANQDSPIMPWHGYFPPEWIGQTIHYFDPLSSDRPLLLEEFGSLGWNNKDHYDGAMHYAIAAGAGAAMSYEWGVSWLSQEAPFVPLPIRDALKQPADPRWFAPAVDYARQNTTEKGAGIAPWPSGFGYGSIYHGTPFTAPAADVLWQLSQFGEFFTRAADDTSQVAVVIPEADTTAVEPSLELFKKLWLQGVQFTVVQASQIEKLSDKVATVLLAGAVPGHVMEKIQSRGVSEESIYKAGDFSWTGNPAIPRVAFSPQGDINCISRKTLGGHLYMFASEVSHSEISAMIGGSTVTMGLQKYAMIHSTEQGINFLEASGEIKLNGVKLIHPSRGRVLVSGIDDKPLHKSDRWKLVATEPAEVSFSRMIKEARIYLPDGVPQQQVILPAVSDGILRVDQDLSRYPLEIQFQDEQL